MTPDDADMFELAWCTGALTPQWVDRHPETATRELVARASLGDAHAAAHLAAMQIRAGRGVAGLGVLAVLDAAAAGLLGPANQWPALPGGEGQARGARLRGIAAVHERDWGLAIERVEGARVAVFAYGTRVPTGVAITERPLAVPAATAPWDDPVIVLPALGLPSDATIAAIIADLDHESHCVPSASAAYRALAARIHIPRYRSRSRP